MKYLKKKLNQKIIQFIVKIKIIMPEGPELRLTADFINTHTRKTEVFGIEKSKISKNPIIEINEKHWIRAEARGKELSLFLYNSDNSFHIRMTMGMSGHFVLNETWNDYPKHAHLAFRLSNGKALLYIDPRRFGKWKLLSKWHLAWSKNRGPSVFDQIEFEHHFMDHLNEPKVQNAYLLDIIMSQRLFNGVGNYLRAEIFERLVINPFRQVKDLSSTEIIRLLKMCTAVAEESYELGGGQLKDWKNPNGQDPTKFREWIKVYGKQASCKDKSGRKFWFMSCWKYTEQYDNYWLSRNKSILSNAGIEQ